MTEVTQQFLLKLARQALEHYFDTQKVLKIDPTSSAGGQSPELKEKRGTFVTLTKKGLLRGCIGHIEPVQEIYKDVIENSLLAAFDDNRFTPLRQEEMKDIEIEISILSEPQNLVYSGADDLLKKLSEAKSGVIIRKGKNSATYLPQVWEDFASAEVFLSSLCEKAGLTPDEWRSGGLEVLTYQAEVFGE